jgi:alpha-tubulin suppressor-like RCC1 family protein
VRCAGRNNQGQLGNGTYDNNSMPIVVNGLGTAISIRTGNEHSCALIADGTMQCWGTNYTGQLGDGTIGGVSLFPETVHGISNAIVAVTGGFHTCAVLSDYTVKCWGRNQDGQIGNGDSTTDVTLPQSVTGLGVVAALNAGGYHTCATLPDRTVRCWGRNHRGQLGNGTETNSSTPVVVNGLSGVAAVSPGGYHTCALLQDGRVQCWGDNEYGQIGSATLEYSSVPLTVSGITAATSVIAGFRHTCAVLSDGTARCWGRNDYGQLGDGTTTNRGQPVLAAGIAGPTMLAGGMGHTCALMPDRLVRCWGENDFGELGNGATATRALSPVTMRLPRLTWTSSNTAVATIDAGGTATAVGQGTTTITATDESGTSATATLTVGDGSGLLTLLVQRPGDGTGNVTSAPGGIACGSTCAADYPTGTQITLTATPTAGSVFAGWSGCDTSAGATCTVTMTQARLVAATFQRQRFSLTVAKSGVGSGTITSNPAGVNCGSACSSDFIAGTTVTLTATASTGSMFRSWSGCDSVSGNTCAITMSAARSATAEFLGVPFP